MYKTSIIGIISRGKNEAHKNIINKQYHEKIEKEQFGSKTVSKILLASLTLC
jgi:hypothetical protein